MLTTACLYLELFIEPAFSEAVLIVLSVSQNTLYIVNI